MNDNETTYTEVSANQSKIYDIEELSQDRFAFIYWYYSGINDSVYVEQRELTVYVPAD